jgi:hypothetical protein
METYYNRDIYSALSQYNLYIKPKTLIEIIKSTGLNHIDFMSLDVEGHELEVLLSWDFSIQIDIQFYFNLNYVLYMNNP